ncbi:hypothetical protein Tco_1519983, partial [Tanacetum coccineum]
MDWRTNAPKDGMLAANSYFATDIVVLNTHRTPIQKQPEALLCLVGVSRRYFLREDVYPTFLYDDDWGNASTTRVALEIGLDEEVAAMGPLMNKRRRERGNNETEANALPKVLRRDHDAFRPSQSTHEGKSLASIGLDAGSLLSTPVSYAKSVSDPEPLSYAKLHPYPKQDIAQSSKGTAIEIPTEDVATAEVNVQFSMGSPESGRSTSVPSM